MVSFSSVMVMRRTTERIEKEQQIKQALTDRKIPKDELPQYLQDGDSDSDNE